MARPEGLFLDYATGSAVLFRRVGFIRKRTDYIHTVGSYLPMRLVTKFILRYLSARNGHFEEIVKKFEFRSANFEIESLVACLTEAQT
jgi:hypothetical protein